MLEIEKSFASNICRCTGYRPILDALKTFAIDAPESNQILDIEDLKACTGKCANSICNTECETEWCFVSKQDMLDMPYKINILLKDGIRWFKVQTVTDIFQLYCAEGPESCMLICGNTAQGKLFRYCFQILI